jgi:hypothetical protein
MSVGKSNSVRSLDVHRMFVLIPSLLENEDTKMHINDLDRVRPET